MNTKSPFVTDLIPAVIAIAFAFVSLTFGMSEWKSASATASAPPVTTQQ